MIMKMIIIVRAMIIMEILSVTSIIVSDSCGKYTVRKG
jgi:hypothetical protein